MVRLLHVLFLSIIILSPSNALSLDCASTEISELENLIFGKTTTEVLDICGEANRVDYEMAKILGGDYSWIWGNTYTEADKVAIFKNGIVVAVSFY